MTKREFDKATRVNYGARMGGRSEYRRARGMVPGDDFVARRAAALVRRNTPELVSLDGYLPTLGQASQFRAPAEYRRANGLPLLSR